MNKFSRLCPLRQNLPPPQKKTVCWIRQRWCVIVPDSLDQGRSQGEGHGGHGPSLNDPVYTR